MSYYTQAILAKDSSIMERVAACAATQGVRDPITWADSHRWEFSAQPGWDAAYAYALSSPTIDEPGVMDSVISDSMILSAVQALRAET